MCHSEGPYYFGVREQERAPCYFSSGLETDYPVLNLINYLLFRIPEVGFGTFFEMFGPSL